MWTLDLLSEREIQGIGWDAANGAAAPFTIEVRTGEAERGATPGDV
jgi:hypothetical protein